MHWFLRIAAGVLLALGVAATAFAATPDGKTAATALSLSTTTGASGTLAGSNAGSYAYYTFNYPGDGSVGTLTITVSPSDPTTENAVGVNVYQAGSTLATMNAVGPTPGTNSVTFSSSTEGAVLVQVYNYDQGQTASYHLSLSGVATTSTTSSAAPAPAASPSPAAAGTAANPISLTMGKAVSGTLPGNPAGSFIYYTINYPGDGSTRTITLNYSPGGIEVGNAVSVNVFQAGVTLASATGGAATAPGQLAVTYSSSTNGPVLIQIGNYNPSPTISYTISD